MKTQDMTPGRAAWRPTKSELYKWLDDQILCVVSSIDDDGYPNSATVAFSQTEDLEFIFITDKSSRKAKNIALNGKVAMNITNENDRYTVQLEGDASEMTPEQFSKYEENHYRKLPYSLPFKDIPGQTPFLVRPVRVGFTDVSVRPWHVTEFRP